MRHRSRTFGPARRTLALLVAAAALAAAAARIVPVPWGLGVQPTGIIGAGSAPVAAGKAATITVFLVKGDRLVAVVRPGLPGNPYLGITQLTVPVTSAERREGLRTEVPGSREIVARWGTRTGEITVDLTLASGRAVDAVDLDAAGIGWSRIALAQLACTAQTVPGVRRVVVVAMGDDQIVRPWKSLTCAEFADLR